MAPPTRVLHHPLSYHAPPFWTCNDQEPGGDGWSPVSQTRPFDLGICFERARVLPALQLAFVILASASVFHLRRQARQSENVAAGTRTSTLTRLALWAKIAALLVSIIVATALALIYKLPIDATLVLSHVASAILIYANTKYGSTSSTPVLLFYPLHILALGVSARTDSLVLNLDPGARGFLVLHAATAFLELTVLLVECLGPDVGAHLSKDEKEARKRTSPLATANIYSIWSFGWLTPFMKVRAQLHARDNH